MARPSKLTPEVRAKLLEATRAGASLSDAAAYAGVSTDSFARYRERDPELAAAFAEAEAEVVLTCVRCIRGAAEAGDWRAALTWLERRRPEEWSARPKLELSGKNGGPIQTSRAIDYASMSTQDLLALRAILRRQKAGTNGNNS
jgi:hypothetical protein